MRYKACLAAQSAAARLAGEPSIAATTGRFMSSSPFDGGVTGANGVRASQAGPRTANVVAMLALLYQPSRPAHATPGPTGPVWTASGTKPFGNEATTAGTS